MKRLLIGFVVVLMIPFSALRGAATPRVLEHLTPHIDERCCVFLSAEQVQMVKELIANKRSYLPTAMYEAMSEQLLTTCRAVGRPLRKHEAAFLTELKEYTFPSVDPSNLMTLFDRAAHKLPDGADFSVLNKTYNHAMEYSGSPKGAAYAQALTEFQVVIDTIDAPFLCGVGADAVAVVAAVPVRPVVMAVS